MSHFTTYVLVCHHAESEKQHFYMNTGIFFTKALKYRHKILTRSFWDSLVFKMSAFSIDTPTDRRSHH